MGELEIKIYSLFSKHIKDAEVAKELYKMLNENIETKKIILDFENIDLLTTAFFNDSIGKIFLNKDEQIIRKNLVIRNIQEDDMDLLFYSIDTALKRKNIL